MVFVLKSLLDSLSSLSHTNLICFEQESSDDLHEFHEAKVCTKTDKESQLAYILSSTFSFPFVFLLQSVI